MGRTYLSPLRYPGAKRQMVHYIEDLLRAYDCTNEVFVEPCCGGASASLYLLNKNIVSSVILADKDPWVASFWQMLFDATDVLIDDIKNIDVSVETWVELRKKEPETKREKALYCFFFNRTCYSGILRGGMIGGHKQDSEYKIDCRFNKEALTERIKWIADNFASRVEVREASVFDILEEDQTKNYQNRVYYIDPPYVLKGESLYPHSFKTAEHERLKKLLDNFNHPWILSYHDHPQVRELYWNDIPLERTSLDVLWVADYAQQGKEFLISNLPMLKTKRADFVATPKKVSKRKRKKKLPPQPELWNSPPSEFEKPEGRAKKSVKKLKVG